MMMMYQFVGIPDIIIFVEWMRVEWSEVGTRREALDPFLEELPSTRALSPALHGGCEWLMVDSWLSLSKSVF